MNVKNIWPMVKERYRLSSKIQMGFELSFPTYVIGKCCFTLSCGHQIRTQKVALSTKGIVFSDTIPLSWFTSSVLIPWVEILKIFVSERSSMMDDTLETPLSSKRKMDVDRCTIELNDPQEISIDFPWSEEFEDYMRTNKIFEKGFTSNQ